MNKPLVSVLMPVYNSALFLKESIQSVLNQTYLNIELIVCNDASSDGSLSIINEFAEKDKRIHLISNEVNMGIVASRNRMFRFATGKYMAIFDSDDIMMPNKIQRQVDYMEKNLSTGICGTWAIKTDIDGNRIGKIKMPKNSEDLKVNLLFQSSFVQSSVMIRSTIKELVHYDRTYIVAEDYDLWEKMARTVKLHTIPEYLVKYRVHTANISATKWELMHKLRKDIMQRQLTLLVDHPSERDMRLHDSIGSLEYPEKGTLWFKECGKWLKMLIKANKKQAIYNDNIFYSVLWYRWILYCVKKKRVIQALFPPFFTLRPKVLCHTLYLTLRFIWN